MPASSRLLLVGCTLLAGSCSKKERPKEAPPATAAPAATPSDAGEAKKVLTATPLAKTDSKPGAAAMGRNPLLELGTAPDRPVTEDRGRFVLSYAGEDSETRALVRASGVFAGLLPQLDQSLRLPRDIKVVFEACDEVNAFYNSEDVTITLCDEYIDYYGELFSQFPAAEAKDAIIGSVVSTFLHEVGHALIDQLALPTVGREEDAADQLSTVILIASGDEGNAMALEGAYAFIAESEADGEETPYWDEHSLDEQRFYNSVCLIYGSDPDGWDDLVSEEDLPEERAEKCREEYQQISSSWQKLLTPYLTVPTIRVKLKQAAP
jgi:Putative metallopeptidase